MKSTSAQFKKEKKKNEADKKAGQNSLHLFYLECTIVVLSLMSSNTSTGDSCCYGDDDFRIR